MKLLILVLNQVELLDDILLEFEKAKIRGATIIDSMGMRTHLQTHGSNSNDVPIFGTLKNMLSEGRPYNKTIFTVLNDEEAKIAINVIKKVMGDISKPNVGIFFTLPVDYVEGIIEMNK